MSNIKIAVIDTNVKKDHPVFAGISFTTPEDLKYSSDYDETIQSHGTAVCGNIIKKFKHVELTVFPICSNSKFEVDIAQLIETLEYIKNYFNSYDIINMSLGITEVDDLSKIGELHSVCSELNEKGVILVASYDNNGSMTYPACFDCVIGVDTSARIHNHEEYTFIKNSPINVQCSNRPQRVAWDHPAYLFCAGSSFVTPCITGIIAEILFEHQNRRSGPDKQLNLLAELEKRAGKIIECKAMYNNETIKPFTIKKAIVLPFNKEIHSLARFVEELDFEIIDFYDIRHKGLVGKAISSIIKDRYYKKDYFIRNIDNIDWNEDFDTIIIGHITDICTVVGHEFVVNILKKAKSYNKQVFAYDKDLLTLIEDNTHIISPKVDVRDVPNHFGKMWRINTPVLGVFGTRSKQGKFTNQVLVKKLLEHQGYHVGLFSSEITGLFVGADYIYPYGYHSTVELKEENFVAAANNALHLIDMKRYDIILTGGQSGVLPYDPYHESRLLLPQYQFLVAANPDGILLCVSPDDELDYIDRTKNFLEASANTQVIAILVYPFIYENFMLSHSKLKELDLADPLVEAMINEIKQKFSLPVYIMKPGLMDLCINDIIDFFG